LRYILTGFTHETGFRVFAFEGVSEGRVRTEYTVKADLALTRRYRIRVQELPLLCRGVLERRNEAEEERSLIYSEAEMCVYADGCAAREASQKRKPPRRTPPSENVGAAWRGPQI
jgi:hypothetical protein